MRQVLSVSKTRTLPSWRQWKQLATVMSNKEKQYSWVAVFAILLSVSVLTFGYIFAHRIIIPAVGGEYTEGLIGEPQFINPIYAATNDVDGDIASLVYSGLVRFDGSGSFVPDLAESISINEEATVYTFTIDEGARFHNGEDVRARDVVFTINAIQTASYRSPLADNFQGVSVVQEDDRTVSFILDKPFAPFLQHLTVGILPASLWADVLPQNAPLAALNLQPIGSGPYQFKEFTKDKKGSLRSYSLERNDDFYRDPAFIQTLTFKFYADTFALSEALENKNVEGVSVVNYDALETVRGNKYVQLIQPLMPKQTNLYFNQDITPALGDLAIRKAIVQGIDKESIVSALSENYAQPIHAPIPQGMVGYHETLVDTFDPDLANSSLDEAGYDANILTGLRDLKDRLAEELATEEEVDNAADETTTETADETSDPTTQLAFTLTTIDSEEMHMVAELIQADLEDIGIRITLNFIPAELMLSEVIEPQNFELLLTSILLEADPDPYPFWHSTQGSGAGLNLVNYESEQVDTLLEEARVSIDATERAEKYTLFQELLAKDAPAVFLYGSRYSTAIASKIILEPVVSISAPSDRFANISDWYIKTKKALR